MRASDILFLSLRHWREKRLRVFLLMLAIAIGVASVIALTSQTAGVQQSVVRSLQTLGPTSIVITPFGRTQLTDADVAMISSLPNVEAVIPMVSTRAYMTVSGQDVELTVIGVRPEQLPLLLGELRLIEGQPYPPTTAPIGLAGYDVTFPPSAGGNRQVFVNQPLILEQRFQTFSRRITVIVSGVLDRYGASAFVSIDGSVFLPLDAVKTLTNRRDYNLILVRASSVDYVQDLVDQLTVMYGNNARIVSVQALSETVGGIIASFGLLLASVAAISLAVAGLGITNIMVISVVERTKEIGVMKAFGYRDREVLMIFLTEAFLIGVFGGLLGIAIGSVGSYLLPSVLTSFAPRVPAGGPVRGAGGFGGPPFGGTSQTSLQITPVISPEMTLMAFGFALMISVLAGIYPAWRAGRLDPVKALRYE